MIRIATEADIPAILDIYAPYILHTTATFEYTVPSLAEFTQRFRRVTAQFPWLVWEEQGKILGYAYGSAPYERAAYQWSGELSIYLAPDAQRRGIGKKLYTAAEKILLLQGYRMIYAIITEENKGSLAFHQRLGYQTRAVFPGCGLKFDRWLGVVWMEKAADSVEIPSNPPLPWHCIVENDRKLHNILATLSLS